MHSHFWLEYPKVRDNLEDMDIEGRITSGNKSYLKFIGYGDFWINLVEIRRQWRAVMIINFRIPLTCVGYYCADERVLSCKLRLRFLHLFAVVLYI